MFVNKECSQNKTVDTTKSAESSTELVEPSQLTYEAQSRGFYEKIMITKKEITVSDDQNEAGKVRRPTTEKEWADLMALLNDIDIKSIPSLEAPTSMRFYDGAAIANFSVTQKNTEIKSSSFDHQHPPKAIEKLVNKVLSIKELIEK